MFYNQYLGCIDDGNSAAFDCDVKCGLILLAERREQRQLAFG